MTMTSVSPLTAFFFVTRRISSLPRRRPGSSSGEAAKGKIWIPAFAGMTVLSFTIRRE
jgi:hypothetical protein